MKRTLLFALALSSLMGSSAYATTIGVSMAQFDDNFLTVLRNGMIDYAKTLAGVTLQVEDGGNDVNKQLSQVQNFVASKVDAIIVNPVDTSATAAITKLAADANIPLVYVNRQPVNLDKLPDNQAFVASNESDSGTLETKQICKLLKDAGKGSGRQRLCHGRPAQQPGRRAAHAGRPGRDRHARLQLHQDHRPADGRMAARQGAEPDGQLAHRRHARMTR